MSQHLARFYNRVTQQQHQRPIMRSFLYRFATAATAVVWGAMLLVPSLRAQSLQAGEPEALPVDGYFAPSWSPDGTRLALTGPRYEGIYLFDLATGVVTPVTDEPAAGFGYAWSPDGTAILARAARFQNGRRSDALKVYYVDTDDVAQLTEYRHDLSSLPRWNGSRVLLYAERDLEVFSTETSKTGEDRDVPTLMPTERGLARVNGAQATVERLDVFSDQALLNVTPSPDGSSVAFEVMGGHLRVMHVDGTGLVDLGAGNRPSWSPDGEWVVFMRTEDDGHAFTASDLYAARADGSETIRLTHSERRLEMNPAWSPDGAHIAYDDLADGRIYLLPISR